MSPLRFPDFDFGGGDIETRLATLRDTPLNFDPQTLAGPGWEQDDYRERLPPEQPGPPEHRGSWETAVLLSRSYAFADPSLVEAHYDPAVPLEQREMLLILHAIGARIFAGVRVNEVGEGPRHRDGCEADVFFWNYRTLEGHVEAGQRDFEVWKWRDSGEVEFRTHAVSRPADANPLIRLGVRLLGRHKQVEFGRRACARMALLTEAHLRQPDRANVETFDGRLLAVYVRDHHALLVALRELARRMSAGDQRAFATELSRAAAEDLAGLETFLQRLGSNPSPTRHAGAWAAEKLGRLKLNGRVLRPSPLTPVMELEGCRLLLESDRALWSGLAQLAVAPADAAERAVRAEHLLAAAERLRLQAVQRATTTRQAEGGL
jgi:uncharacterized protein (UPF0548 family)